MIGVRETSTDSDFSSASRFPPSNEAYFNISALQVGTPDSVGRVGVSPDTSVDTKLVMRCLVLATGI